MWLPRICVAGPATTPEPSKPLTARPCTTEPALSESLKSRPFAPPPADDPSSSIRITASEPTASVFAEAPGCEYPSIVSGSVIGGNGEVGEIVNGSHSGKVERDRVGSGAGGTGIDRSVRVGGEDRLAQRAVAVDDVVVDGVSIVIATGPGVPFDS